MLHIYTHIYIYNLSRYPDKHVHDHEKKQTKAMQLSTVFKVTAAATGKNH